MLMLDSPVPHKKFDRDGKFVQDRAQWREWVEECANAEGTMFNARVVVSGLRAIPSAPLDPYRNTAGVGIPAAKKHGFPLAELTIR